VPASRHPPPSAGRGARERILAATRDLYYRQGINVTGVAELCAAARISKRTLYQHFASKEEVVTAYLAAIAADPGHPPNAVLTRADLAPRARLLELYPTLAVGRRPLRGCPFVNVSIELADPAHPARRLAITYKREFVERLAALAREAGARSADQVGHRLGLLYDGAAAEVTLYDSPGPAGEAQALAAALLRDTID
jgi:AcrR family transcriptional regulator